MHLVPGTVIDQRYEVESTLGSGGMGSVFRARQIAMERSVAVKLMHNCQSSTEEGRRRFEREALVLSKLHHRNIISLYAYGVWNNFHYTVMEYAEGKSLQTHLLQNGALSIAETINITKQLCAGLEHAHAHGVVHRDLKPTNIMLERDERNELLVKIVDFGLVKTTADFGMTMQRLTETGFAVGTAAYMSPEQCTGTATDHRADIYALGTILHHCLAGSAPFFKENEMEVMKAHLLEAPPEVASLREGDPAPPGLQAIIYKAMAKRPEDRYQSVQEFANDLSLVESGSGQNITSSFKIPNLKFGTMTETSAVARRRIPWMMLATIALFAVCIIAATVAMPDSLIVSVLPSLFPDEQPAERAEHAAATCLRMGRPMAAYDILTATAGKTEFAKSLQRLELMMQAAEILESTEPPGKTDNMKTEYANIWQVYTMQLQDVYIPPKDETPIQRAERDKRLTLGLKLWDKIMALDFHPGGNRFGSETGTLVQALMHVGRYDEAMKPEEWLWERIRTAYGETSPVIMTDCARVTSIYWYKWRQALLGSYARDYKKQCEAFLHQYSPIAWSCRPGIYYSDGQVLANLACCYYVDGDKKNGNRCLAEAIRRIKLYDENYGPSEHSSADGGALPQFIEEYSSRLSTIAPEAAKSLRRERRHS